MRRQPVKIPIILAILSALVLPIATLGYAGLYAMEFAGLLSIFSTASILLDVFLAFLFLIFTWGNVYLLHAFLHTLPELPEKRKMFIVWKVLAFVAGALSLLTPLYSIFPDAFGILFGWLLAYSIEFLAGIIFSCLLMRFALRGRNSLMFAMALALALSYAFDFSGCRVLQTQMDQEMAAVQTLDEETSGECLLLSLWGLSPAEFETLDEASLADVQEISVGVLLGAAVLFAGFVILHSAAALVFYVLVSLYFVRKNAYRPNVKWRRHRHSKQEVQIC